MANLALATNNKVEQPKKQRALVRAAAKVAPIAKKGGEVITRAAAKGGAMVASGARRGTRAVVRAARENWKTIAMNEGLGLGSHALTFFLDRKAMQTYLQAIDNPVLRFLTTPSNILAALQMLGLAFTRGGVRKFIREAMRGTLHAKVAAGLHSWFPDMPKTTSTRGHEEVAGPDEEEVAGPDEEEVAGPDEEEVAGPDEEEVAGPNEEERAG